MGFVFSVVSISFTEKTSHLPLPTISGTYCTREKALIAMNELKSYLKNQGYSISSEQSDYFKYTANENIVRVHVVASLFHKQ